MIEYEIKYNLTIPKESGPWSNRCLRYLEGFYNLDKIPENAIVEHPYYWEEVLVRVRKYE